MSRSFVRVRAAAVAALAILAVAGCSAQPTGEASTAPNLAPSSEPAASVTVSNCGTEVSFDAAPQRVVTIKSSTTEALLALGLGERIIGMAFQDGPVPEQWAAEAASIPVISPQVPSEEAVLELEPDLVFGGWESAFSPEGAGARADLAALGIASYVSPAACQSAGQPAKLSFDDIDAHIQELAAIFRVDASSLLAEQRSTLTSVEAVGAGRTALWYSSGNDTPYVGAGIGAPQLVLETVGLTNIAGDVDATWAPLNWEAVVDANPDFIVLIDAAWNTAQSKIEMLDANPATAALPAVQNRRYLILPFAASEAGVRTVEAAASLAAQIMKLDGS